MRGVAVIVSALLSLNACTGVAGEQETTAHPAVLFTSRLHTGYFAKPLYEEGVEVHTCTHAELPARLASGDYHVLVYTDSLRAHEHRVDIEDPAIAQAVAGFMAQGGGVLLLPTHKHRVDAFVGHARFLQKYGANYSMVVIHERDPANIVQAFQSTLQFTDNITAPFNDGVEGLLYYHRGNHEGASAPIDLLTDDTWTVIARASDTAEAVPYTQENKAAIKAFVPAEVRKAPTLLAARDVGKGRLAALTITPEWMFTPPNNCPPVEDMMTRGRGGRPSHWVRLLANTFRYLAEPSMQAGVVGAPTLADVVAPRVKAFPLHAVRDWKAVPPIEDQKQLMGLIGARSSHSGGKATVAEWVTAAKAAKLDYLVFLEPIEAVDQKGFDAFKAECAEATDDSFFACPGIWGRDVMTKTAMFMYGENAQYPQAKNLTEDGKQFLNREGLPESTRTRYIFDYFFEQLNYQGQFGYFRHKENGVPPWEYKMNHVFPVFSTENGKPLDSALEAFSFLQAQQFHYHPAAFSLMDDPGQITRALEKDWITINTAPGEFGDGTYTKEYGAGVAAMRKLFTEQIGWLRPFQYITSGPRIPCWRGRWEVVVPYGEWFRPDLWRYRTRLHVTSDAGIKEIRLMSNGRVIRRFLPGGAKEFDRTFEWENSTQRALYPVIEDVRGGMAIGSYIRNSNTMWNEFICGDRCNYLSYGTARTKDGKALWFKSGSMNGITHNKGGWYGTVAPAQTLTIDYPTLPIDGQGGGKQSPQYAFGPVIDTDGYPPVKDINCRPKFVMAGPDVCIGGGHVDNVIVDPKAWGNAWSWWSAIKRNEFLEGYGQTTLFNYYPGGIRAGWYEFRLTARRDVTLRGKALPVHFVGTSFTHLRDAAGKVWDGRDNSVPVSGPFPHGAYALTDSEGGPVALISLSNHLVFTRRGNTIQVGPKVEGTTLAKGTRLEGVMGFLGAPAATPVEDLADYVDTMLAGLSGLKVLQGKLTTDALAARFDGEGTGVSFRAATLGLNAYVPILVAGLNPNWDAWLLDRTRAAPNWRQLQMLDGTAYAAIPGDVELNHFLGHPVLAENRDLTISLCNTLPGRWLVTFHNSTDREMRTSVWSAPGWAAFTLKRQAVTIAAGTSLDLSVQ